MAFIQQPALSLPTHKTGGALIAPPEVYSGQNARTLELATEFEEIAKIVK